MENRAYSVLDIKSVQDNADAPHVIVRGIATTPRTDRMGDVVESKGARYQLPMPLLLHHQFTQPVGRMVKATPTDSGIEFEAEIPRVVEPGKLKDRVDEALHSLQYGLINAVSIGFRALANGIEPINGGTGVRYKSWEWLELSLVTVPANSQAVISAIKSFDQTDAPATGPGVDAGASTPGVSGSAAVAHRGAVQLIPRKPK